MNIYFLVEGRRCERKLYPAWISALTPHLRQVKSLIETWLLGNRRVCRRNPQSRELRNYVEHYDTRQFDPEAMPKLPDFNTHAQFHCEYLKAVFRERRISYTKTNPGEAATPAYLRELVSRSRDCPEHIRSFSRFLAICSRFS